MPSDKLSGLLLGKKNASNDAPPAPPPLQPIGGSPNPYDFITNSPINPKKSFIPGGNSKMGRVFIALAGIFILLMIILIGFSLLNSGSTALKSDYADLVGQQAELIRVSEIGTKKARQTDTKNLAITTQFSLTSQQPGILALAKKAGASTDAKTLAFSKNSKTDTALDTADQANNFDEEFLKTLLASLKQYQASLKKIYDATPESSAKDTLSKDYNAVSNLLGIQSKDGTSSEVPATN